MKTITTFGLLVLVLSMTFGGVINNVYAEDDPTILLKIAKRAQEQIHNQISDDSSDKVKGLFEEGAQKVIVLEEALKNNDSVSAKEYFLSAMKIFKEISQHLTTSDGSFNVESQPASKTTRDTSKDPSNDLQRLQVYVDSLKTIAKRYDAVIDFSELDTLFVKARQEINDNQFTQAIETIDTIKETITELNTNLREAASQQESQQATEYAQKYLEQLDRLIENAKKQGVSDEIIEKLETAKENLSSAENPSDIIQEIRKIMSIKDQFELTKNDRLESRVLQIEKTLLRLSQMDGVEQDDLADVRDMLQRIKQNLNDGEFETVNELLRDLAKQLEEIKKSL
jgi:antitoxin component HigA of HigAB toxin-antitoxin module